MLKRLKAKLKALWESVLYFDPIFHEKYTPNLKKIGLELTSLCNCSCVNCEASCRQAPSGEYMSIEQIEKFVRESLELKWNWGLIKLRGGEPTLHPQILKVLEIIKRYKDANPLCGILLQTNGYGKKVQEVLSLMPSWVEINNSKKKNGHPPWFSTYNVAPKDLKMYQIFADFKRGCWRTSYCNMALSRYGYYSCSPGANVDRVFGFDIGIKRLSLVTVESFRKQLRLICQYCGHFKEPNQELRIEKISLSWQKAYEKYKEKKPSLKLY